MKLKIFFLITAASLAAFCMSSFAADSQRPTVEDVNAKAEAGDPEAQYSLAMDYVDGQDVKQDDIEANKWLRKSAEQGYPSAQYTLGCRAFKGLWMDTDLIEAAKWLKLAALVEAGSTPVPNAAENLAAVIRKMSPEQKAKAGVESLVFLPSAPKAPVVAAVNDRKLLGGLESVGVVINVGNQTNNSIKERLQTAVELRLRAAGVKVDNNGLARFELTVTALSGTQSSLAFYNVEGALTDIVFYKRISVIGVQFWRNGKVRSVSANLYERTLIDDAQEIADQFANDYLAANPKK